MLHDPFIDDPPVWVKEVERNRPATSGGAAWAVDFHHRPTVRVSQLLEAVEQPAREAADALVDHVDADVYYPVHAGHDIWDGKEVEGAVFECHLVVREDVPVALGTDCLNGATGEPGAPQPRERLAASDQAADPGWVPEHFVPAHRDEVGMHDAEIEPVGGHVSRCVEQHIIAIFVGQVDPVHRVLYTR